MNKIAFVYPGQGVQKPGMGADFYKESKEAEQIFNEASPLPGRALPPMIHSDFFISSLFYTVPGQRCKPSFLFFSAGLLSPQKNSGVPTNAAVLST